MKTFYERLKEKIAPKGYEAGMRRSVQSAIMFEAQRCVEDRLNSMRPFQRKIAFFDQMVALLETLDFIAPHYRAEVMWRTATSKDAMTPEIAWKRSRLIDRELGKLAEKIKPHMLDGVSHEEACDAMVQEMFENVSKEQANTTGDAEDNKGKERPPHWEHAHNNVVMTFRMYYKGDKLDPDLPPPTPPVPIVVPTQRPSADGDGGHYIYNNVGPAATTGMMPNPMIAQNNAVKHEGPSASDDIPSPDNGPAEQRQSTLKEVRDHLELLKQFDGIIPADEINRRKRELFLALPPAPPPSSAKRHKV